MWVTTTSVMIEGNPNRTHELWRAMTRRTLIKAITFTSASQAVNFVKLASVILWAECIFIWFCFSVVYLRFVIFTGLAITALGYAFSAASTTKGPANPAQARMPSAHVWSKVWSPSSPQFLNQEPPRAQQLSFPDFLFLPHCRHLLLLLLNADGSVTTSISMGVGTCVCRWSNANWYQ